MRRGIIAAVAGLAFLTGCANQGDKAASAPATPKWKGPAYRISYGTTTGKPNPSGLTIPPVKFTANPEALETRTSLVVQFDSSSVKRDGPVMNKMIMAPVDIKGAEGTLPADYLDRASKGLSTMLSAYCMKGKVKISVALARSSLSPQAGDAEVDAKRLSDWAPIEVEFKNPHAKCPSGS